MKQFLLKSSDGDWSKEFETFNDAFNYATDMIKMHSSLTLNIYKLQGSVGHE